MNRKLLIKKFLEYYESHGHKVIDNASLVPMNDPTVLFTTAGMQPLVPYLSGQSHPLGKRLCNVQGCIRTNDIDEVGDSYHHTFFEMLGKWSLGDYDKRKAIEYTYEFHTKILKIPLNRYAVTVFAGNAHAPKDKESYDTWLKLGIPKERIAFLDDNWWGPAGTTGPCGPDTEMFYWKPNTIPAPKTFDPTDNNWVEISNDVLMEYVKDKEGNILPAKQKNIDFGGGVERTVAALTGLDDNYRGDMWWPLIEKIESLSGRPYAAHIREMRILADHVKASVMMMADGVVPSNTEQGYVLRRLLRRSLMNARKLNLASGSLVSIAAPVFGIYDDYKHLLKMRSVIESEMMKEEERFAKTLDQGLKVFERLYSQGNIISGTDAFLLFQSYGFPVEMTMELATEKGIGVDKAGYDNALKNHQELSRTATEGKFKSGLADHSEATTRLHTATHLLLAALNKVLPKPEGLSEIVQRGSNITSERARFDFSYDRKLSDDEIKKIEDLVNSWLRTGALVERKELLYEQAKKFGAMGVFDDKYKAAQMVSVYVVGDGSISKELCTGPHVSSLKEFHGLRFKIDKQESVGSGNRRVKVVLVKE